MGNLTSSDQPRTDHVLPKHLGGGPLNLGDPDDRSLRKVEKDILILNMVRDRVHKEKCSAEAAKLDKCGGEAGLLVTFKCGKEKDELIECSKRWFHDEGLRNECTEEFLKQRSYYRRTGKPGYLHNQEEKETSGLPQFAAQ
ncbi:hypothetical protein FOCC_FOCC013544 [Frankliniella occidentalis]|uniref:COX assembly mitochondrial protein n=1 Tax=Frankliniella occidentalis TaxID=133901 RepID=A0A6J1SU57_FRAOC|nr:COX assembly mitochondrial protein homolog [Frankliniella occidentalis]KAE8740932.1 hypothetical protein FOCC_FOCC013544 [Frankliniella occidentalis]